MPQPITSVVRRFMTGVRRATPGGAPDQDQHVRILDQYVLTAPSPQNALNIFRGEWASKLPEPMAGMTSGFAWLFEDERINWFEHECGGFEGKTVLELGPLEAGHTYMAERKGAAEIVAVEANTWAFLKCLIIKELFEIKRAKFLCGDFVEYLRAPGPRFDLCIASGVLYHMRDPVELIALLADRCAGHLMLWTHYYDESVLASRPGHSARFPGSTQAETRGFRHTLHRHEYGASADQASFCGGTAHFSRWMERDSILACLEHFGFGEIRVNIETPDHPSGPCFTVVAERLRPVAGA